MSEGIASGAADARTVPGIEKFGQKARRNGDLKAIVLQTDTSLTVEVAFDIGISDVLCQTPAKARHHVAVAALIGVGGCVFNAHAAPVTD
jgi:hypothetical protein